MPSGRTLPCFIPYDPNPRASGYISDRFLSGLRPQDFYFHCMAGREGLIDTAVKTANSGYLQRCLIKQLEALVAHYDYTVRDSDGSIIQFVYGEDSIDTIENKYLNKFKFMDENYLGILTNQNAERITERVNLKKERKRAQKEKKNGIINPTWKYFGSCSEKMETELKQYIQNDCQFLKQDDRIKSINTPVKPKNLESLYSLKFMKSLIHPGENVGTIAAQSVGEPSTQMTLNTFHLAGHGGANVTLGIPRLREVLMTASESIKTPMMTLPLKEGLSDKEIQRFAHRFQKLNMQEVVKKIITETDIKLIDKELYREYEIEIEFESMKRIKKAFSVDFDDLISCFYSKFIPLLMSNALKQAKKGAADPLKDEE